MDSLRKLIEAVTKLAPYSDKLIMLVLSLTALAAVIVVGMQGSPS